MTAAWAAGGDGPCGDGPAVVVVPCFNEERRLDPEAFRDLTVTERLSILFVDDGSTDHTSDVLGSMSRTAPNISVLTLEENSGKAEAVRRGLLLACRSASFVGYLDADLAASPDAFLTLLAVLRRRTDLDGVLGARVALLGHQIHRRAARHYSGRVYATLASITLGIPVYDTQCGAKVFRVSDRLVRALDRPFRSSWAFDSELLFRMTCTDGNRSPQHERLLEVPLQSWTEVGGSKLSPSAVFDGLTALATIAASRLRLRVRGSAVGRSSSSEPVSSTLSPYAEVKGAAGRAARPLANVPARRGRPDGGR
jgi:hypothetical protein